MSLLSIGQTSATLSSQNGNVTAVSGGDAGYAMVSAPKGDVSVTGMGAVSLPFATAGGSVYVVAGGVLGGNLTAGADATAVSLAAMDANVTTSEFGACVHL